ncbi:hypothetical protein ALI144C_48500 [Actinosynnema sp. ALI-1.44]|uniref:MauE/DoxX family redox-associated membrane protein n=1 Tax=Actinosynnema sp. ALI-1.44 TaxID=1933779 RepID=UPI00097C9773|nr:MauE/DoxX family redox-associated membrane protein [Actinosynnema sp. ALI-1.44]ONI71249.1 hypothetical protein ALI144C_48500 [Actinosynnema sp. ALI-1.44]
MDVLVAAVLLWAAVFKLRGGAQRSALAKIVGKHRVTTVFRIIGGVEVALAAGLLLAGPVGAWAAFAWFLGLFGYLLWARVAEPESSCGCLADKYAPVGVRALARAAVLAAMAVTAELVPWFAAVPGAVVIVLLSAELDGYWLVPLRRLKVRLQHPLGSTEFHIPVASTVQQLHKSQVYQSAYPLLRSDVLDTWDEGEWRILTYSAERDGERATAVFAVPRERYEPDSIRFALT